MRSAYVKYIAALLLFGSNGIIASFINLSSYEIVFMRTLIGSLFLIAVFLLGRQKAQFYQHKKQFIYLMISGAAMGVSWMFLFEAYRQVGVSVASLAYYCGPVIVMALAPVVFRERASAVKVIGFAAVIAGMLLVNGRGLREEGLSTGLAFGILSAVQWVGAALILGGAAFGELFRRKGVPEQHRAKENA